MLSTASRQASAGSPFEQMLQKKKQSFSKYAVFAQQSKSKVWRKKKRALVSKESQIDDVYRKAVRAAMQTPNNRAAKLQSDISIQKAACSRQTAKKPQLARAKRVCVARQ